MSSWLEPEVRKRLVRFRHAVHFLAFFHRTAATFRSLEQLRSEPLAHRFLAALARRLAQPAHRERHAPHGTHLDWHLEIRATHAAALDLDHGLGVGQRLVEDFERVFAAFFRDRLERPVDNALGDRFLAFGHQHIDEFRDVAARIFRIRQDLALGYLSTSGHRYSVRAKVEIYFRPAYVFR